MVEVSIIVPIRFRADLTKVCIDSLKAYTKDCEIILVQEGEDEEISDLLKSYQAKYVHNKEPKGYSGALNAGLKLAEGKYICFMNNDTVVTPGWMDEMLGAFKECEDVGLVTPTFWGSGGRQSVDWNNGVRYDYVNSYMDIIGVCFLIPKYVLDKVGNWDEGFFHGGEDFDITYRIQKEGYNAIVARNAFIYHYGGASTRELFEGDIVKVKQNVYNKMKQFADKHNIPLQDILDKINLSNKI